ncbi:hypothetical protein RA2_00627 [Roseovarius sp. A-2]|uniref:hypothetical protein n=1 Tax=Roseovarius sp. A-2 TaxID=1570360 RepID=UPI0009D42130|nr:hypothetical protein [Roseovarius sp. A-2]GAW33587.1 hypothetical protein RA2_00627 [Roseovarius sp. A-2]
MTRLLLPSATGTIGRAVVVSALAAGYKVDCVLRSHHANGGHGLAKGAHLHFGTVAQAR